MSLIALGVTGGIGAYKAVEIARGLQKLGHDVVAVRLYDPFEMTLPELGLVLMQDAETGEQIFVDTHDRGFRQRYHESSRLREAMLNEAFKRAGVDITGVISGAGGGTSVRNVIASSLGYGEVVLPAAVDMSSRRKRTRSPVYALAFPYGTR